MRRSNAFWLGLLAIGLLAMPAVAAPEGWHKSMKDGLEASAKSGKPLLVVTSWSKGL